MSQAMSLFVILGTLLSLVFFIALLHFNQKKKEGNETTGHTYDGIKEYDNPLPTWWYWLFMGSIFFGFSYLLYYPGLGNFEGLGKWNQLSQMEYKIEMADKKYSPIFNQYAEKSIEELIDSPAALKMGRRLFINNCAACHGSTGNGSIGFPNLTDNEWIWGGEEEQIKYSIFEGRKGNMTAWQDILEPHEIRELSEYIFSLVGREVDSTTSNNGFINFQKYCTACHGSDGKGISALGSPDLTNELWLYGNSRSRIEDVISKGRKGIMPPFKDKLGHDKVHILTAYVKSLSEE